jgi:hypothetical protein
MTKSPKRYDYKQRRAVRRRNHIARDLWEPKYRPRRVDNANRYEEDWREEVNDWYSTQDEPKQNHPDLQESRDDD